MSTQDQVPKAVLYYNPKSIWSAVVLLCLYEKGYGSDELDLKIVDVAKGENYDPTFLRLNSKATVPTLVVPLHQTLSEHVESRYKAITESTAIVEFLDKSRSAWSRTHTTSDAPAPMLTPATMAFAEKSKEIIEIVHGDDVDPNMLWYYTGSDEESLRKHAREAVFVLKGRSTALADLLEKETQVSAKTKQFWADKKGLADRSMEVFLEAEKAEGGSQREAYFAAGQKRRADITKAVERLEKAMIGPYALGDQISMADVHLAGWLARVAKVYGCSVEADGKVIATKVAGTGKIEKFWDEMKGRASWKKVYVSGLF